VFLFSCSMVDSWQMLALASVDEDEHANALNWAEDLGPGAHGFPFGMLSALSLQAQSG